MSENGLNQDDLAEQKLERERFCAGRTRLCKALKARGFVTVTVEYDGEGDSGQIDDISAYDRNDKPVRLDKPIRLALHDPKKPTRYVSLHEALDDFAWTLLRHYHAGFEDNNGGFGTITIDVPTGKVTIDHNDRFTDVHNTVTEV